MSFIGHYPCDNCGSSDGLAVYEKEDEETGLVYFDATCFAGCGKKSYTNNQLYETQAGNEIGVQIISFKPKEGSNSSHSKSSKQLKPILTEDQKEIFKVGKTLTPPIMYRGLTNETLKYFGVLHNVDDNGEVIKQHYPVTYDYKLSGYKTRVVEGKKFFSDGRTGAECNLFGQFRFRQGGKKVIIGGGECYHPDTEVLTESGWVKIPDLQAGQNVLQVHQGGTSSFVEPLAYIIKDYEGDLYNYHSTQIDLLVTPNHKMSAVDQHGVDYNFLAKDLPKSKAHSYRKAVTCNGVGVGLSNDQLAFIVAMSADSKTCKRVHTEDVAHFAFIKERKIARLKGLLDRLGMEYTEYGKETRVNVSGKKYHSFNVRLESWCSYKGLPTEWVSQLNLEQKEFVLSEVIEWDGNRLNNRQAFEFSSKLKSEAELVQSLAVTSGKHASIRLRSNDLGEWYSVKVSMTKDSGSFQAAKVSKLHYSGKVHCVTVPSGNLLVRYNGKVVVCGNCDMLSIYQVMKQEAESKGFDAWPVVSPTVGENCAAQLLANYEFFDSFDQILLGFDNDEAGRAATEAAIEVLPKGKVYVIHWPDKDPNESLLKGKTRQLINACWQARKHIPDGITGSGSLEEKMREYVSMERLTLPPFMHRMQKMLCGGIPFGYIVNLLAGSGVGKSTVVDAMILHWIMQNPHKVGIMSLEASEGEYGVNLSSSYCGFKLNLLETARERLEWLDKPENVTKRHELWFNEEGEERFFILDADIENLQRKTEYGIISLGWKVIVYDPLQDIFDCLDEDQQKKFMKWQKDIVKRHGVIMININHSRKASSGQKAASRGADLSEEDMMGTSTIFKSGGINIVIGRDKEAEDPIERNTTYAKITKARGVGNTGHAGSWYYDNPTHTMHDKEDYFKGKGVSLDAKTQDGGHPQKF